MNIYRNVCTVWENQFSVPQSRDSSRYSNVLQCTAVYNTEGTVVYSNVLQCTAVYNSVGTVVCTVQYITVGYCIVQYSCVLQCTAQ